MASSIDAMEHVLKQSLPKSLCYRQVSHTRERPAVSKEIPRSHSRSEGEGIVESELDPTFHRSQS